MYGAVTLYRHAFLRVPLHFVSRTAGGPTTPGAANGQPRFGLLRVRSPLLAQSFLLSFPPGTKMFQFPGFAPGSSLVPAPLPAGFPIRTSAGHRAFAPHRGFSQLITSFFASESHRHPPCALVHFLCYPFRPRSHYSPKGHTGTDLAYIRLARFFRFSQSNRFDFLVLRSHHVNDLF